MKRPDIKIIDLAGSYEAIGQRHGELFSDQIHIYLQERVGLITDGLWSGTKLAHSDVIAIAESMLAAHQANHGGLYSEMTAMAEAAGISAAEAVIVGGFTDFVDTVRAITKTEPPASTAEDDCTAFIVPDALCAGRGFYGQTWDMHDSATDHVVMFRIKPADDPAALVFTTTGALGQIGMNEVGVCVGINNLSVTDGKAAVTWPQVVRKALLCDNAVTARDFILESDLAGAHSYQVFDANGIGFNIEATPTQKATVALGDKALLHTNHCLYDGPKSVEADRHQMLVESSHQRLELARQRLDHNNIDETELMELTREPTTICQLASEPFHIESSGAAIMQPSSGRFWACWGLPSHNKYLVVPWD